MDARPTAEQQALRDVVAEIVRAHAATTVHGLGDAERIPRLAGHLAGAGLLDLRLDDGGEPRASGVELAIIAEELGRGAAEAAFVGPTMAADLCRRAGVACPSSATILLDPDLISLATPATAASAVALDLHATGQAILLLEGPDGLGLAAIPVAKSTTATDLTRPVGQIGGIDEMTTLAGPGSLSPDDLIGWRSFSHSLLAADLLGSMRGAHEMTVAYAKDRQQYGRPVGSFQAVQHLLAESLVWLEGAQSAAYYAAWAADAESLDTAREASLVAKIYCAIAARTVCELAIQVHGGIGNTWECMVHVHLRRVLQSGLTLGGEGLLLEELAMLRQGEAHGLLR
jgi:alkylation response protein AidB-like acyl-CoA dehydrogenase